MEQEVKEELSEDNETMDEVKEESSVSLSNSLDDHALIEDGVKDVQDEDDTLFDLDELKQEPADQEEVSNDDPDGLKTNGSHETIDGDDPPASSLNRSSTENRSLLRSLLTNGNVKQEPVTDELGCRNSSKSSRVGDEANSETIWNKDREDATVAASDDPQDNLEDLNVRVFDQEVLEDKVSKEIEAHERKKRLEKLTKESDQLEARIAEVSAQLKKSEDSLKALLRGNGGGGGLNSRKCSNFVKEQEKLTSRKTDLMERRKSVEEKIGKLRALDEQVSGDDDGEQSVLDVDGNRRRETAKEKDIRLGLKTAFGTVLKTRTVTDDDDERPGKDGGFMDYVRDQLDKDNIDVSTSSLSTKSSARRKTKRYEDDDELGTDDSAWESSDQDEKAEDDLGAIKRKIGGKFKRGGGSGGSNGRVVDDGDREEYVRRIEEWHANRTETDVRLDSKYEALEGGLRVPQRLWSQLYQYQRVCVQWLWELDQQKVGGILGDEMGLGKTVQIIAYLASMSYSSKKFRGSRQKLGPSLIVCPTTVMHQWVREFHRWWPLFRVSILHESGSHRGGSQLNLIKASVANNGVLITSYNGVVSYQDHLRQQPFDYVILDEGHKIRNPDSQATLAVKSLPTSHRLILSGSPLQNNLKELWSLFDFIYPGKLGTLPVFMAQFSVPITIGGYSNASKTQVATAYKCATVLRDTINPYLLRRMKSDVKDHIHLPAKNDQVLFCRLTEEQRRLYLEYINGPECKNILNGRLRVFMGLMELRKICNHPDLHDGGPKHFGGPDFDPDDLDDDEKFGFWKKSGKMIVIESLLKLWKKQGHKVLLFTQSRQMLTVLHRFVTSEGYSYIKMDGGTAIGSRQTLIDKFNSTPDLFVFLLTTKVGGLGVNLTGASRVVIFDPDWNPSTDMQARERAWRIGQEKDVTIYRLLTSGTIEEKIYHRQIFKQLLCNRVLKDPTQRRIFKSTDLYDLFTLNEGTSDKTETSALLAGTNSEVNVKPQEGRSKRKSHKKKHSSGRDEREKDKGEENYGKRRKISKDEREKDERDENYGKIRKLSKEEQEKIDAEKKRQLLREKAKLISQKIAAKKIEKEGGKSVPDNSSSSSKPVEREEKAIQQEKKLVCRSDDEAAGTSSSSHRSDRERREKRRKRGHRRKDAKFEGEHRVSHLVKQGDYKAAAAAAATAEGEKEGGAGGENGEDGGKEDQDNYVLAKLFKKSGVHSAVRHDVIVEGGGADFALIEGEAERIAKDAVSKLKESRRQCFRAESGLPTWTGSNGVVARNNANKPRFGKQKKNGRSAAGKLPVTSSNSDVIKSYGKCNTLKMSSSELLDKIRSRNRLSTGNGSRYSGSQNLLFSAEGGGGGGGGGSAGPEHHLELLTDIRNFVAFQAEGEDGEATTDDLVKRFRDKLPTKDTPLFKALLQEICVLNRDLQGRGVWRLKAEFR